ncbi:MAG: hypothetical protein KF791_06295 [Verrucomicrobiae bacterium]|nr:hypothetical protein [Verrucomicrobiae bacterium]
MKHLSRPWRPLFAGVCLLVFVPFARGEPRLARINGGNSAAVIGLDGRLWTWGDIAFQPRFREPGLLPWQPRPAPMPPDGGRWTRAALGFVLVAQSDAGGLYLLQRVPDNEPAPGFAPLDEPLLLGEGPWTAFDVGGFGGSWVNGTTRAAFVAVLTESGRADCLTFDWPRNGATKGPAIRSDRLPFPPGVLRWKQIAAGYGFLMALGDDGRLYDFSIFLDSAAPLSSAPPRSLAADPDGGHWTNITANVDMRFAWSSSGRLYLVPPPEATWDPGPLDIPSGGQPWADVSGYGPLFLLRNASNELWLATYVGTAPQAATNLPRSVAMASANRFSVLLDTQGVVRTVGDPYRTPFWEAVSGTDFPGLRGPAEPFEPPASEPPVVTIEAVVPQGASPETPDAPASPAVFRFRRSGDPDEPLVAQLWVTQSLALTRLAIQGLTNIQSRAYGHGSGGPPEAAEVRFEPGQSETEVHVGLRYTESGGAPLRFGLQIADSVDYLVGTSSFASVRLVQTVPSNPLPRVVVRPLSNAGGVAPDTTEFVEYEVVATVANGVPVQATIIGTNTAAVATLKFPPGPDGVPQSVVFRVHVPGAGRLQPSFAVTDGFGRTVTQAATRSLTVTGPPPPRFAVRVVIPDESHMAPTTVRIEAGRSLPVPANSSLWVDVRGDDGSHSLTRHPGTNATLTLPILWPGTYTVRVSDSLTLTGTAAARARFRILGPDDLPILEFATNRWVFRRGETGAVTVVRRGATHGAVEFRIQLMGNSFVNVPIPRAVAYGAVPTLDYVTTDAMDGTNSMPAGAGRADVLIPFPGGGPYRGNRGGTLMLTSMIGASPGSLAIAELVILEDRKLPSLDPVLRVTDPPSASSVNIALDVGGDPNLFLSVGVTNAQNTRAYFGLRPAAEFRYRPAGARLQTLRATVADRWGRFFDSAPLEFEVPTTLAWTGEENRNRRLLILPSAAGANIEGSTNLVDWETVLPWELVNPSSDGVVLPTLDSGSGPDMGFYRVRFAP